MNPVNKRPALPYPAQALRDRQYLDASPEDTKSKLHDRLSQEYHDLQYRMDLLEARLNAVSTWQSEQKASQKKAAAKLSLPALSSVQASIGQLYWSNTLTNQYKNLGDSAGNISGIAWCNGLFLSAGYFLTAGHCFDKGGGWQRPNHYGVVSPPETMAPLFKVRHSNDDTNDNCIQIEELTHHRPLGLDCAIVRMSQHAGSTATSLDDLEIDLTQHKSDKRDNELFDAAVYLVDYQPSTQAQENTPGVTHGNFHEVQITQHHNSLISFTSLANENTLSGTPLMTSDGNIIGLKISDSEAVDIGAIAQIIEADKPVKKRRAQA